MVISMSKKKKTKPKKKTSGKKKTNCVAREKVYGEPQPVKYYQYVPVPQPEVNTNWYKKLKQFFGLDS